MTDRRRSIGSLLVFLAAALTDLADARPAAAAFKYLKRGMEAQDFALRTLDDQEISLAGLKQNRAVLLVFWATWSPKSEPALREAQALRDAHGGAGLRVVAFNLNRQEIGLQERALVEKTVRDLGVSIPVVLDPGFAVSSSIGVVANPSLALLDSSGVLVWEASGWSRNVQDELRAQVEILLGTREAAPATAAAPRHVPVHKALLNFNLGRTFLRQGNAARARSLFESAAEQDQAWAAPRTLLGHLLLQLRGERDAEQAERLFREAAKFDPEDVSALSGLGEALLRLGRVEEAAQSFEKAHALDAAFTPAVAGRAMALARLGRSQEALALFDAALDLNPRDAAIFAGRGACREVAGDVGSAAADYRRAVEILIGSR